MGGKFGFARFRTKGIAITITIIIIVMLSAANFLGIYYKQELEANKTLTDFWRESSIYTKILERKSRSLAAKGYATYFNEPYPLVELQNQTTVSLTGIYLGSFIVGKEYLDITNTPILLKSNSGSEERYDFGNEVYGLQLIFKISSGASYCDTRSNFRRYIPESGDLIGSNNLGQQFYRGSCDPNTSVFNKKLTFVVPEEDREFILTSGGESPTFFKITALPDKSLSFEKIETPAKYRDTSIGVPKNTWQLGIIPGPLSIKLTEPAGAIAVPRGSELRLVWEEKNANDSSRVSFQLVSPDDYSYSQDFSFKAKALIGTTTIKLPPGTYNLQQLTYPAPTNSIKVTVLGLPPIPSALKSQFYFEGSDSIISDGICSASFYVIAADEYGYKINDQEVGIFSSRGTLDSIKTDIGLYGGAHFSTTSKTPGTSTLTVLIGELELPFKPILKVLDASNNNCPTQVNWF